MENEAIWGSINKSENRSSREVIVLLYCAAWEAMPGVLCLVFLALQLKKKNHILETVLQKISKMIKGTGLHKE